MLPSIHLKGHWLEEVGFGTGTPVNAGLSDYYPAGAAAGTGRAGGGDHAETGLQEAVGP
ncbi:SymE family type I addiction module toxin [Erwinia sp. P6884]|uniref:SymE family type I addiction module toxin n=1 Tax=Erwinia sp. P6884 TaxID=3141450 RepID=UPI0031926DD7